MQGKNKRKYFAYLDIGLVILKMQKLLRFWDLRNETRDKIKYCLQIPGYGEHIQHSQSTQVNVYYRTLGSIWSIPVVLF